MKTKLSIAIAMALALPTIGLAADTHQGATGGITTQQGTSPYGSGGTSGQTSGTKSGGMGQGTSFTQLDTNDDGKISKDEAQGTELSQEWKSADQNQDNKVDQGEFARFESAASGGAERSTGSAGMGTSSQGGRSVGGHSDSIGNSESAGQSGRGSMSGSDDSDSLGTDQ